MPASAKTDTGASIDPVTDQTIWNERLQITGTYPKTEEVTVYEDFHSTDCYDENGTFIKGSSGSKSIEFTLKPDSKKKWTSRMSLSDTPPGDYIFRAWIEGDEENRIVKLAHVTYTSADVFKIELTGQNSTEENASPEKSDEDEFYEQNSYLTPGFGIDLTLEPDLSSRGGRITKGDSLKIDGQGQKGKDILVLISRSDEYGEYTFKKYVKPKTSTSGFIVWDNELLSSNETMNIISGRYYIYAIMGTKDELSEIEEKLNQTAPSSSGGLLKANEDENPYQQFVMLLEEPWIRFSGTDNGKIPDAGLGRQINISGTTNLDKGTWVVVKMQNYDENKANRTLTSIIPVSESRPYNTWSTNVSSSNLGVGNYSVKVSDYDNKADASAGLEIRNNNSVYIPETGSAYAPGLQNNRDEPESTATETSDPINSFLKDSPFTTIIMIFEGIIVIGIILLALKTRK
ncbi:hypothetical protein J2128_001420 [Methanomicrobium sp. W14]|uniref:hypothetical protein n=1 Tax=Methanomicrobium sp. W14 TaxID=2817839 RepID=UPI001AE35527|nr:hypothetical protein [Methanomicrobium sp. W14]MBP2133466.1 hypothetical protein [Methanomicrobium sp. W14]